MLDDKYIGLLLAVSSSLAIGTSAVITKLGLNAAGTVDGLKYLRSPIWWAGFSFLVLGEIGNFAAYAFAPPMLVTPLGALSVLIGAVLASFMLNERLGHLGRVGCALSLLGSLVIVLHAPEDRKIESIDEILDYAIKPAFLLYVFLVLSVSLTMIIKYVPSHGRTNPIVYLSICSLMGSVSVMGIKAFGLAIKLTLGGSNQFGRPSTWLFGIVSVVCILVQTHYQNMAFAAFDVNIVNPIYYVGFSTATIIASLILFQGYANSDFTTSVSLFGGFVVTFIGVHILNISRQKQAEQQEDDYEEVPLNEIQAEE